MSWLVAYARSSVGAKQIMAITGLLLVLFALQHMVGHMVMFVGREAYNDYAHFLQSLGHGWVKWIARAGLLATVAVHIGAGLRLAALNAAARPVKYHVYRTAKTPFYARWMVWTGLAVFAFLAFHIFHFTVGMVQPQYFHTKDPLDHYDAYTMYVRAFKTPWILGTYLVGMTLLLPHVMHGISSLFQSLGWKHPKYDRALELSGPVLGIVLYLGYITPPIAVLLDIIKLPGA